MNVYYCSKCSNKLESIIHNPDMPLSTFATAYKEKLQKHQLFCNDCVKEKYPLDNEQFRIDFTIGISHNQAWQIPRIYIKPILVNYTPFEFVIQSIDSSPISVEIIVLKSQSGAESESDRNILYKNHISEGTTKCTLPPFSRNSYDFNWQYTTKLENIDSYKAPKENKKYAGGAINIRSSISGELNAFNQSLPKTEETTLDMSPLVVSHHI